MTVALNPLIPVQKKGKYCPTFYLFQLVMSLKTKMINVEEYTGREWEQKGESVGGKVIGWFHAGQMPET